MALGFVSTDPSVVSPLTARFGSLPSGIAGVRATLKLMVQIVRASLNPPAGDAEKTNALLILRTTAQQAVQSCPEKNWTCEAATLQKLVQTKIRYVRDMRSAETLQYPLQTLQLASGDCDDKAILLSVLAECIGFHSRFCAIGVRGEEYSHVSAQLLIPGNGWVNVETIPIDTQGTKAALGWFPPDATCLMLAHI